MKQAELLERLVELNNEVATLGENSFHHVEYLHSKKGKVTVSMEGQGGLREMTVDEFVDILLPPVEDVHSINAD